MWVLFLSLALVWGSSFFFIKIGLDAGMGPFTLVSFRLLIGTAFLASVMRLTHRRLPRAPGAARRLVTLSVLNIAIPFLLLAWGEQWISSAVTGIFNSLTPLFAIVLAAVVLQDEPITLNRLGGLALGFLGALLLASPNISTGGSTDTSKALLGELAVAAACLSYACGAVYTRHRISGQPLVIDPVIGPRAALPVEIALPQVGIAAVLTSIVAVVVEHPAGGLVPTPPSIDAWIAVAWLGILGSGVAYLLFFPIVRAWGATRTTMVTYLMPVVSIGLGVLVLSEQLLPVELLGGALILGGLLLANASVGRRRLYGRHPAKPSTVTAATLPRPDA